MGILKKKRARGPSAKQEWDDWPPVVHMPPNSKRTIEVKITRVRKAEPQVVAPDED